MQSIYSDSALLNVNTNLFENQQHQEIQNTNSITYSSQNNCGGFIPFFRGGTADLNTTLALTLVGMFLIQFYSIKYVGFVEYIQRFFNFSNPINAFVGILEIVSEFSKILSFSFRLFGNIFAG